MQDKPYKNASASLPVGRVSFCILTLVFSSNSDLKLHKFFFRICTPNVLSAISYQWH